MKATPAGDPELRRRQVAMALADGLSVSEIARALKVRRAVVERDRETILADPNNLVYLSPKRAFAQRLDAYDALEGEARSHMASAIGQGKLDVANKWFESIRRIAGERGRLLAEIGLFNRALDEVPVETPAEKVETLSPKAKTLVAKIMLAERRGRPWEGQVRVEEAGLEPVPDPEFATRPSAGPPPSAGGPPER